MAKLTLMAVLAHPDDESFGVGGTLAKYAAEGCDVHLVTATRGEAGQIVAPGVATPANLPQVREQELRCACATLGIHPPHFLDYVDGQLAVVHQGQAVGKVVRLIRQLRPQVLVTFDPQGGYGHYDHIAVHRWATIAYDLAAKGDCFPEQTAEGCIPHQVSKLYYHVNTEEQVRGIFGDGPAAVMMDGVPFAFTGVPQEDVTTMIDIRAYAEIKMRSIACHVSQVGDASGEEPMAELQGQAWANYEAYVLARSTLPKPEGIERDLFAGLR
jgi:LmbE family N-acetylglucosaminyl deacetylase